MYYQNLNKLIMNNYDLEVNNITKVNDSTEGNVYLIENEKSRYIFKIYKDFKHTEFMIKLHKFLSENNFYVPKIIQTSNKNFYQRINDSYIIVYSFLEGIQLKEIIQTFNQDMVKKLAKEIRRIHEITKNRSFCQEKFLFDFNMDFKRKSILHFDLTKDNIFISKNEIGFIDFDDAKFGPSVYDVAITISLLFISKKRGIELDKIKMFIDSYYEDDEENKQYEGKHIKEIAIEWIDYLLEKNSFDTSTHESFEVKKKLIQSYL